MDKKHLLNSAKELKQVSDKAASEYHLKKDELVSKMNGLMLKRADIDNLVGENNIDMMKDNHANHVRFIASILKNHNPEILVDTVLWVFRAYRSRNFKSNYWAAQLNTWVSVIKETLSAESFNEIYPYYEWMQINIPVFVNVSDEKMDSPNSLH